MGNIKAALADAGKARDLDPSSMSANILLAHLTAEDGDLQAATALLDSRIDLGGENRNAYLEAKANLIGVYGEPMEALALLDDLMTRRPGSPELLNSSCWIKGTRQISIDTALKDCTRAIELSSYPYAALDSRSMIWFRKGAFEDALRDLDAILEKAPALAPSRFMRAIVLTQLDRTEEAATDLRIARRLDPGVDRDYERFGIVP